ncbi:MAG: exodeoxyribonuclease III [Flavobacteriales bacterium]|nr:exodeoxyribonuclease III [Flavobacteriales bacterium]
MKIVSYNVNGIRAAMNKNLMSWIESEQIDILCFQETKAMQEQIDVMAIQEAGFPYYYFHSAQKKGYSGVGIISKHEPNHVEIGTNIDFIDNEGRVLRADFDNFSVISLYLPSGTNIERLDFKMEFCYTFSKYIQELKTKIPNLIIVGDYNICHEAIDIHDPVRNANVSGFLPIEREWLSSFINECKMVDSFRHFNKEPHNYSWWSYRANARNNNKGWRIDYCMVSDSLKNNMKNASIYPEAKHSDHCPISVELEF